MKVKLLSWLNYVVMYKLLCCLSKTLAEKTLLVNIRKDIKNRNKVEFPAIKRKFQLLKGKVR